MADVVRIIGYSFKAYTVEIKATALHKICFVHPWFYRFNPNLILIFSK